MKYDLVISSHPKDHIKLKYCYGSIKQHFDVQPDNKYVVSPTRVEFEDFIWIHDDELPVRKDQIHHVRPNWMFQQFVKSTQDFTQNDTYMVVDCDVIFNRAVKFGHNFYISDRTQHHPPYFKFMKDAFGLDKQVPYSFINDFMVFERKIFQEIIGTPQRLLELVNHHESPDCFMAEFEVYGNYVTKHYPGLYGTVDQKVAMYGKYLPALWTDPEILNLIAFNCDKDIDLFTMHSWT